MIFSGQNAKLGYNFYFYLLQYPHITCQQAKICLAISYSYLFEWSYLGNKWKLFVGPESCKLSKKRHKP